MVKGGRNVRFEDIFNDYYRDVFHFALALSRNRDTAEEIAHEAFTKALKRLNKYDGVEDYRAWLFTIARNVWYDMCKKNRRTDSLGDMETETRDEQTGIPERLADSDTAFEIHRFLHHMPEPYKEVFNLRVFGELPYERIAAIFGKSAGWARVVFYRAKKQIQDHMEDYENGNK